MKSGPPRAIGELLLGALPQLEDRLLVQRMRRTWSAVVGADVARRAQPQALVDGCLTVVVDNSPWLHEMTLRADELTARLRERFPSLRALRFTLGTLEAVPPAASPRRDPRSSAPLGAADLRAVDEATSTISDPTLAAAARRLLTKAWRSAAARGAGR